MHRILFHQLLRNLLIVLSVYNCDDRNELLYKIVLHVLLIHVFERLRVAASQAFNLQSTFLSSKYRFVQCLEHAIGSFALRI